MSSEKMPGGLRLMLAVLLAPAVVPVVLWFSFDPLLTWFRPQGSNMAIGMFYFLIIGAGTFMKGALWPALVIAIGISVIPLLALEFVLGLATAGVTALAVLLASFCFYTITRGGRIRTRIEKARGEH